MKSAQQAVDRWKAAAPAAGQSWLTGVQNTSVDVMGRAVNAIPAAIAGYTQSLQSGAYARAVAASGGTANWKSKAEAKQGNYVTGINAGSDAYASSIGKIMQAMPGIVNSLPARGPAGSAANEARVVALTRALHARKGDFKG
jgi:hypothetical protein